MESMDSLKAFVDRTGDSQIVDMGVYEGLFTIQMELDPHGEEYVLRCPARRLEILSRRTETCVAHLRLQEVDESLRLVHGRYAPPNDFGRFMKCINDGTWLAFGEKPTLCACVMRVVAGPDLARVLVTDVKEVTLDRIDDPV
jgi:hypothetical protein